MGITTSRAIVTPTTQSQTEKNTALCRDTERLTRRKKRPIAAQSKRSSEVVATPARLAPTLLFASERCIAFGRLPGSVPEPGGPRVQTPRTLLKLLLFSIILATFLVPAYAARGGKDPRRALLSVLGTMLLVEDRLRHLPAGHLPAAGLTHGHRGGPVAPGASPRPWAAAVVTAGLCLVTVVALDRRERRP